MNSVLCDSKSSPLGHPSRSLQVALCSPYLLVSASCLCLSHPWNWGASSPSPGEIFMPKGPENLSVTDENKSLFGACAVGGGQALGSAPPPSHHLKGRQPLPQLSPHLPAAWRSLTIWKPLSSDRKSILVHTRGMCVGAGGRASRLCFLSPSSPAQEHSRSPGRKLISPQGGRD